MTPIPATEGRSMQLPFSSAAGVPSRAGIWRAARKPWVWIAVITAIAGTSAALAASVYLRRADAVGEATLRVSSDPGGASVRVGGRTMGHTPLELRLAAGDHQVTLH